MALAGTFGLVSVGVAAREIDNGVRYFVATPDGPAYLETYLLPTGVSNIRVPYAPDALLFLPDSNDAA